MQYLPGYHCILQQCSYECKGSACSHCFCQSPQQNLLRGKLAPLFQKKIERICATEMDRYKTTYPTMADHLGY